jgi:hypothetical protein
MGRTVPTFTNLIDAELASWSKFRRGLRKDDQEVFDEIFRAAKLHLAENFYAMRAVPFESIMMSIVVEQQKAIRRLEEEIKKFPPQPKVDKPSAQKADAPPAQSR